MSYDNLDKPCHVLLYRVFNWVCSHFYVIPEASICIAERMSSDFIELLTATALGGGWKHDNVSSLVARPSSVSTARRPNRLSTPK